MEATDEDKTNKNHKLKSHRVDGSLQLQAVRVGSEGSLSEQGRGQQGYSAGACSRLRCVAECDDDTLSLTKYYMVLYINYWCVTLVGWSLRIIAI